MWRPTSSATAPFRKYNKTDAQAYAEGVQAGLTWRDHWNHKPGGPWVPSISDNDIKHGCPDWANYCLTLRRHKQLYLQGWEEGNAARLANAAAANKLVCLLPA